MKPQLSCISCKKRKSKCDKLRPCSNCNKRNVECIYIDNDPNGTRKRKEFFHRLKTKHSKLEMLFEKVNDLIDIENIQVSNESTTTPIVSSSPTLEHTFTWDGNKFIAELVDLFFSVKNQCDLLVSPTRKKDIINPSTFEDSVLKTSICAVTLNLYCCLNDLPHVDVKHNQFYKTLKELIKMSSSKPSIQLIQAMYLCSYFEMGNGMFVASSLTNVEAIRLGQCLNLHLLSNLSFDEIYSSKQFEAYFVWCAIIGHDRMISMVYGQPLSVSLNTGTNTKIPDLSFSLNILNKSSNLIEPELIRYKTKLVWDYLLNFHSDIHKMREKFMLPNPNKVELNLELDNIIQTLNSFGRYEIFNLTPTILDNIQSNLLEHPYILLCYLTGISRITLLVLSYYFKVKLSDENDPTQLITNLDLITDCRKLGLRLYKYMMTLESRIMKDLNSRNQNVLYLVHYGHVFSVEWSRCSFAEDTSTLGKNFNNLCKVKLESLTELWPLFKVLGKHKMCRS